MRMVVDTGVVLSGLRSASGASRLVLLAIRERAITLLASVAIMLECESVLKRGENLAAMDASAAEIDVFLDALAFLVEPISLGFFHRPMIRDPDDEIFVEAAINGHADALVTFNRGDYLPVDARTVPLGIDICRPGDLPRARRGITTSSSARAVPCVSWSAEADHPRLCARHGTDLGGASPLRAEGRNR